MIRDINMSGNLYQTLKNITAVGNDLTLSKTGGCGKGQMKLSLLQRRPPYSHRGVVIGGR